MHTYRKKPGDMTHDDKWCVGYYTMEVKPDASAGGGVWYAPPGQWRDGAPPPAVVSMWHEISEHDSEQAAIERVNQLNGGVSKYEQY